MTPRAPWHYAVLLPLTAGEAETAVLMLVTCRRGEVGVGLLAEDGSTFVTPETFVRAGETRLVSAQVHPDGVPARWLVVRNGGGDEASECDLVAAYSGPEPSVELTEAEVALALRDPVAAHESCARRVWPAEILSAVGARGVPLRVSPAPAPLRLPRSHELWSGATDSVVLQAEDDLTQLLERGFDSHGLEPHVGRLSPDYMRLQIRMSVVRVVRLVETLRRRGFDQGSVLEVGCWFGNFALALRRLGYDIVACDRYSSYGEAFHRHVGLLRDEGIHVVSTTRERELDQIANLGRFDVVLAGAVIEHVPHTPRHLLETLFGALRPGGLLVLDTPNLARYWNLRALERGQTVFQPLEDQFRCDPPWEGHHREYTARELGWMLEQVGCESVEVEFFDYNMLQYAELSAEHTACLARIVEDPSQSDTLLASGRRPAE